MNTRLDHARAAASRVVDPELPMLTLADLGVLHRVEEDGERIVVGLLPTYSGCPALAEMRADVVRSLADAGFAEVDVVVDLTPAWSSDRITAAGRRSLQAHGIAPPGPPVRATTGPVPLTLEPLRRTWLQCPRCGSDRVEPVSEFGATPCTSLQRCASCLETFPHVKEI